ncbi:hypothetical protein D1872_224960 [compost metagenome]
MNIYGCAPPDITLAIRSSSFNAGGSIALMSGIPFVLIMIAGSFCLFPRSPIDANLERFDRIFARNFNFHGNLAMDYSVVGRTYDLYSWRADIWIIYVYRNSRGSDTVTSNDMGSFSNKRNWTIIDAGINLDIPIASSCTAGIIHLHRNLIKTIHN